MFVLPVSTALQRAAMRRPLPDFALRAGTYGTAAADGGESRAPRLDVIENDAAYSVVLDMPGVAREQLDVTVEGRRVKVSTKAAAGAAEPAADDKSRVLYRERGTTPYARSVLLPDEVDNAQSQASFSNGVLTLTLAKRSAARATQIQVN